MPPSKPTRPTRAAKSKASAKPKAEERKKGEFPHDRTGDRKLTVQRVVEALQAGAGLKTQAAAILKCDRSTLYSFMREHPEVQAALDEIEEQLKDIAEGQIVKAIQSGDMQTVRWWTELKAKDRGYNRRLEVGGPNGGPIETRQATDLSGFSEEELEILARGAARRESQAGA